MLARWNLRYCRALCRLGGSGEILGRMHHPHRSTSLNARQGRVRGPRVFSALVPAVHVHKVAAHQQAFFTLTQQLAAQVVVALEEAPAQEVAQGRKVAVVGLLVGIGCRVGHGLVSA
jgi:hypothetical protein